MIIITEICLMPPKYKVVNLAGKILCYTINPTYKSIRKQLSTVVNFRDRNTIDFAIRIIDEDEISIVFKELKGFDSIPDNELFSDILSLKPSEFIGAVPPNIGYLKQLTQLYLRNLDLTELQPEIGKLINLEYLDISHNKLTDLPMSLKKLKKLNMLIMSWNSFPRIPQVVAKIISLKKLNIHRTHIYHTADYLTTITKLKRKKPDLVINCD